MMIDLLFPLCRVPVVSCSRFVDQQASPVQSSYSTTVQYGPVPAWPVSFFIHLLLFTASGEVPSRPVCSNGTSKSSRTCAALCPLAEYKVAFRVTQRPVCACRIAKQCASKQERFFAGDTTGQYIGKGGGGDCDAGCWLAGKCRQTGPGAAT